MSTAASTLSPPKPRRQTPAPATARPVAAANPPPDATATPAWMWAHLLSLDAPLVAVGWQRWWGEMHGGNLSWEHSLILGLSVWMVYLADRLADAWRSAPELLTARRHRFSWRRRKFVGALLGGVAGALVILAPISLSLREFGGGLALLGGVGAYFGVVHGVGQRPRRVAAKEAAVAAFFAVGVGYFVCCKLPRMTPEFLLGAGVFCVLCFLNCALITRWEGDSRRGAEVEPGARWRPEMSLGWGCAALALLAAASGSLALAPVSVGAGGLWLLDCFRGRLSADALRVLADVVLLAPWLALWLT